MKHIFMGKINSISYDFICYYKINGYWIEHLIIESLEEFNKLFIEEFHKGEIESKTKTVRYEPIKETTDIQERISKFNKVKLNNEELYVEKVVQCDNGDVICYTSKILKEIEDEESKRLTEKLKDDCYKIYEEYIFNKKLIKQEQINNKKINNKKWWQFWKR